MNTVPNEKNFILVIEDDPFMQGILNQCLIDQFDTIIMNDGLEAFTHLQQGNTPDIIISDLNTPKLNGLEFLEQVKSSGFFQSIPVVILSGTEGTETRIKCLEAGAEDYILKPFNPRELIARINTILKRAKRLAV